jgi:phthalate 4,5-dioxygenase oxygenase subunit
MIRQHHWIPVTRAARVHADGAPVRVRLFGEDLIVFRATDGRVALFLERYPQRSASLALARNEDCALRCIFHGWKFDVSGKVIETPNEPSPSFTEKVKLRSYHTREAGGIWGWLGEGDKCPAFPDFEFDGLPESHLFVASTVVPFNWVQALEATIDALTSASFKCWLAGHSMEDFGELASSADQASTGLATLFRTSLPQHPFLCQRSPGSLSRAHRDSDSL